MRLLWTVIYLVPLSILMGVFSVIRFVERLVNKPLKDKNNSYS